MKVISYSLFGFGKRFENCFEHNSYLRGLALNLKLARLVYPDWTVWLQTDEDTYNACRDYFEALNIKISINNPAPLTLAMLWRLKPIFEGAERVICRDLDSPLMLKEAKCVKYWESTNKSAHAITDSISHNIPMLGGMIGFDKYFSDHAGIRSFDQIQGYNWEQKGADQHYLNQVIYPCFSQPGHDSITQHYLKGMPNTWLTDFHDTVPDMDYLNEMEDSNSAGGHIGCAGFYMDATLRFLKRFKFADLDKAEILRPDIFYWVNEN